MSVKLFCDDVEIHVSIHFHPLLPTRAEVSDVVMLTNATSVKVIWSFSDFNFSDLVDMQLLLKCLNVLNIKYEAGMSI